jgi:hypothetical protein
MRSLPAVLLAHARQRALAPVLAGAFAWTLICVTEGIRDVP